MRVSILIQPGRRFFGVAHRFGPISYEFHLFTHNKPVMPSPEGKPATGAAPGIAARFKAPSYAPVV
ncbi:hypothetical protein A4R26_07500 [Niastella populi]|uniref:Uncharacterized protein n=1 Tax=Niastella populi TaxID=550983 RepID=A0A1V9EKA6_9BACT|nr:hypothetical protein A4R26_07500 [Niastella populi]